MASRPLSYAARILTPASVLRTTSYPCRHGVEGPGPSRVSGCKAMVQGNGVPPPRHNLQCYMGPGQVVYGLRGRTDGLGQSIQQAQSEQQDSSTGVARLVDRRGRRTRPPGAAVPCLGLRCCVSGRATRTRPNKARASQAWLTCQIAGGSDDAHRWSGPGQCGFTTRHAFLGATGGINKWRWGRGP